MPAQAFDFDKLNELVLKLREQGYHTLGAVVESEALTYREISSAAELAIGYQDTQSPGKYRIAKSDSPRAFDCVVGPSSLKSVFHQPVVTLFEVARSNAQLSVSRTSAPVPRTAVIGVRPCELTALQIQDKVLGRGEYADSRYVERRHDAFIVVVNCTRPGGNCFCTSMGTGPSATSGFDLSLTELELNGKAIFVVRAGTERGETLLASLNAGPASDQELEEEKQCLSRADGQMGLRLDRTQLKEALTESHDSSHWAETGSRCMACGNCTSVCPTCFCTSVEDHGDISRHHATRVRKWTSCFTSEFTYLHGGHVRQSVASRYRHWITHKLSAWHDQFGMSGCVGCGRCITWCPVGINIVDEATAILQSRRKSYALTEEIAR